MKHEPSYYDFDIYLALRNLGFARTRINELEQELKKARDMNANLLEENHKLHETILSWVYRSQSLKMDNPDDWIYCVLDGIESFTLCTGANRDEQNTTE
jgi:hypothetical protein